MKQFKTKLKSTITEQEFLDLTFPSMTNKDVVKHIYELIQDKKLKCEFELKKDKNIMRATYTIHFNNPKEDGLSSLVYNPNVFNKLFTI